MIEAQVIADSVNPAGNRVTSFVCTYPRFILAEVNTHRMLSRNSASSRAIPASGMVDRILADPVVPVSWGKNQKGMQADEELPAELQGEAWGWWMEARDAAAYNARQLIRLGVHKQIVNRLLEPFCRTTTIISGTEWGNFFNLRCHKDAQPEFQSLAYAMLEAYRASTPVRKNWGQWHIPFGDQYLDEGLTLEQRLKICVARAARVSYWNFDGQIDHDKDYALYDQLLTSGHVSPFEHAAMAQTDPVSEKSIADFLKVRDVEPLEPRDFADYIRGRQSNFRGWLQYRKTIPNENRAAFDPDALLEARP